MKSHFLQEGAAPNIAYKKDADLRDPKAKGPYMSSSPN